jgi:tRNA-specific 2-thiouridylase
MKVAVGMSGGVDSSVAAFLLVKAGHEVSGLLMKIWPGPDAPGAVRGACYGPDEIEDIRAAESVCARLGIALHVIDCAANYEDIVLRYFREGYLAGTTPNPCVRCNQLVKFGILPEMARASGLQFERFATGHYAHVDHDPALGRFLLKRADDPGKDQSYFLYRLSQEQLASSLFPLGGLFKSRVRAIAREEGLPVHDRRESQDFYDGDLKDILGQDSREGDIVDREGRVLGRHGGVWNYTIGQRKGLGIAFPVPLYVTAIDALHNRLVVGPENETYSRSCTARDCAWIKIDTLRAAADVRVKVRSGGRLVQATISPLGNERVGVAFFEPVSSVAPGQSAVFYDEDTVVGGGIIETAE